VQQWAISLHAGLTLVAWAARAGDLGARFKPYSKFPACYKDIAFWVSPEFSENNLCELVRKWSVEYAPTDLMHLIRASYCAAPRPRATQPRGDGGPGRCTCSPPMPRRASHAQRARDVRLFGPSRIRPARHTSHHNHSHRAKPSA
jgi:hypothetical protein